MKFNVAWAQSAAQNVTLKVALMALCGVVATLTLCVVKLALRKPLIIDRACYSTVVEGSSTERSAAEIDSFLREAIRQRFNSDATPISDYLSSDEMAARSQEQKDLATRTMTQVFIVRGIKTNGNTAIIDADRLISVAQIRSAFSFPLTATFSSTTRTQDNPYGLQLIKIIPPKME